MQYSFIILVLLMPIALLSQLESTTTSLVNPNYLPAYSSEYPEWAKLLYDDEINYYEVSRAYENWKENGSEEWRSMQRYYKLWRKSALPFLNEKGVLDQKAMKAAAASLYQEQLHAGHQLKNEGNWRFYGPQETFFLNPGQEGLIPDDCPWQVNVYSFAVSNQNEDILYCGTETGFVNKTVDGGENWELVTRDYPLFDGVTAIAIDPFDDDIAYFSAGNQMHKTVNGGDSWSPLLPSGSRFRADKIIIHPSNSDIVLAAGANGIFKSNDAGQTWVQVWVYRSYDIEFDPSNPDLLYALTDIAGEFRLSISTNGGNSFTEDETFPTGISNIDGGLIAISPAAGNLLYAILLSENNTPLLYRGDLTDGVWRRIAAGNTNQLPMNNGQGFFDLVLEVDPINPEEIFVGILSLYKSTNGGTSFEPVGGYQGEFPIHPDIQWLELLGDGRAWVATDGGMTYSTDNFTSPDFADAKNRQLVGSDMWGFDQAWNEDLIVGGRYHNGNTAIADYYQPKALRVGGAESPTGWIMKGKQRHAAFNDLGPGIVLPKDATSAIEGRFPFSKYPNMDEFGGRRGNVFFHPNYYEVMYLGEGNGFWRSDDMGESFNLLYDFGERVRFCQVAFSNPNVMYADVLNKGLYKSIDGGRSWTHLRTLTQGAHASPYWAGRMHLVVSPTDPDVIYVCLKNGTWSADIGKVLRSVDGGNTWEDWSGSLEEFTKLLAIQPDENGEDIVYLFTNSRNGANGKCFVRKATDDSWSPFDFGYPAGMNTVYAAPFFRDSKIRVAGNAGVWESQLLAEEFEPQVNAWVNAPVVECALDTFQLEDHSIVNHSNCRWNWEISPQPVYIEDHNMRNPKVVFGDTGIYTITLNLIIDGQQFSKTYPNMVQVKPCPSVDDCDRPALVPKQDWELLFVSSEEIRFPGRATMAFDGDISTIWHSRWTSGNDAHPHEIQIDMKEEFKMMEFIYQSRQDGENGRILDYELYISNDPQDWGQPDFQGQWENSSSRQAIEFATPVNGRYLRLVALSEVNGNPWTSVAELTIRACYAQPSATGELNFLSVQAFPIPATKMIEIPVPDASNYRVRVYDVNGVLRNESDIKSSASGVALDFTEYVQGIYWVILQATEGTVYRAKVVKQ